MFHVQVHHLLVTSGIKHIVYTTDNCEFIILLLCLFCFGVFCVFCVWVFPQVLQFAGFTLNVHRTAALNHDGASNNIQRLI